MSCRIPTLGLAAVLALGCLGCVTTRSMSLKSSVLDYLYPQGKATATPAGDVTLRLPLRVGVAFAPGSPQRADSFTELQKQQLLDRIAAAFREEESVGALEVIPSSYLSSGGSFDELNQLATAFGIDLVALVSYDQQQFGETTNLSWTYLTVLGAFAIKGEKNETRTVMDTVVYDIPSRALLFRAAGNNSSEERSTPVKAERRMRQESERGLAAATDDMIAKLHAALAGFREQVKTGTVRGQGTPAVQVVRASTGGSAGGALGWEELLAAAALVTLLAVGGRGVAGRRA